MCTVHHHSRWPAIQHTQGLTRETLPVYLNEDKEPEHVLTCHRIKRMLAGFKIWQFTLFRDIWLDTQKINHQSFLSRLQNVKSQLPNSQIVGTVPIRTAQIDKVDKIVESLLEKLVFPKALSFARLYGVSIPEQILTLREINLRAKAVIAQMPESITMQNADTIATVWTDGFREAKNQFLEECGYVKKLPCIQLTNEDRDFLRLKPNEDTPYLHDLDCTGFAFLKSRETLAIPWINSWIIERSSVDKEKFYEGNPIEFLQNWGYRMVDSPDTGDLVCYLDNITWPEEPKISHTGIYQEDGTILSKLSIQEKVIWQHPLNVIPAYYGNLVIFFRKTHFEY